MNKHKRFLTLLRGRFIAAAGLSLLPAAVFAKEVDLEQQIAQGSMNAVLWASAILLGLIAFTALTKKRSEFVFGVIVILVVGVSAYLIGSTVYLNNVSSSKGPVHWHADTEIWACGQEVSLKDPTGALSNKIGTSTLHEHNDKRIHLEGVVVHHGDASLGKFFKVIDGEITSRSLTVPTNEGPRNFLNGQLCNGSPAEVQVFVYKTNAEKYYTQEKVADPATYTISAQPQVPAGDCIIIEFDAPKDKTDRICRSYQAAEKVGKHLKGPAL